MVEFLHSGAVTCAMKGTEVLLKGLWLTRQPLSHDFNTANYFRGICHLRTIKGIRIQS